MYYNLIFIGPTSMASWVMVVPTLTKRREQGGYTSLLMITVGWRDIGGIAATKALFDRLLIG